jgi:hypothetical protein
VSSHGLIQGGVAALYNRDSTGQSIHIAEWQQVQVAARCWCEKGASMHNCPGSGGQSRCRIRDLWCHIHMHSGGAHRALSNAIIVNSNTAADQLYDICIDTWKGGEHLSSTHTGYL